MATMINTYTFGVLIERIQKFLANNYADISNNITANEILTYVYPEMGLVIEKLAEGKYQADGIYPGQDGFITTYSFPGSAMTLDWDTDEYKLNLPAPVLNLPLGIAIKSPYFIGFGGKSFPLFPIAPYQRGYDAFLPSPDIGGTFTVENMEMAITVLGVDIINSGWTLKVPMLSPRSKTGADTDTINLPDSAIEMIFEMVIDKLVGRKQQPQNNVNAGVERYTEKP